MADYITLDEAAAHLRIDMIESGDDREPDLQMKIDQAEAIVVDYLKYEETGWDEDSIPRPIKAAMLLVLSALWDDREGKGDGDYLDENGAVARLLRRYRDPALA